MWQARVATAGCVEEATALRAHLVTASRDAQVWNTAWAIGFGAAAAGQAGLALAETKPFGTFDTDYQEMLYVGAVKATIGMGARLVLPLRIEVPDVNADPCADVMALRDALERAGRKERRAFWLTLIGGTAVNLAGSIVLMERRDFGVGALSFALGFPIGPLSAYTQPRASWRQWEERRSSWVVGVGPRSLWLAGSF
jgi:hypothetical protein